MTISLGPSASTGTLEANQVKTDTLFVNGTELDAKIDALITQRIHTAFNVSDEIGLPSSTDYEVQRNSIGDYTIIFADTWNDDNFETANYSVSVSQRGRSIGSIASPSRMDLYVKNKSNTQFDIENVERESSIDGDSDTHRDVAVIDFICVRGMVAFCQGSFRGGAVSSFGKI